MNTKITHVQTTSKQYPIFVGTEQVWTHQSFLEKISIHKNLFIITNETIYKLYQKKLHQLFDSSTPICQIPDGEEFKNQDTLNLIYNFLITNQCTRNSTIIAFGGGCIGDMAGFAASTFMRGIELIHVPTTLLAMVDAAIGGKTAIHYAGLKNHIGTIYQPNAVLVDLSLLFTLPVREFRSGIAEIIKYGLLSGGDDWLLIKDTISKPLHASSLSHWQQLIFRCIAIKAEYISVDESDKGIRNFLNLGHTFAHALEAITDFKRWLHGEAVAIGLFCQAYYAWTIGVLPSGQLDSIQEILRMAGLLYLIPTDIDLHQLIELMYKDKKNINNDLRLILCRDIGECYIESVKDINLLKKVLSQVQEGG